MKKDKILYGIGIVIFCVTISLLIAIAAVIFYFLNDTHNMNCCLILEGLFGGLTLIGCFCYSWIIIDKNMIVAKSIIKVINVITWDDIDHIELRYKAKLSGGRYSSSYSGILHYVLFSKTKHQIDTDGIENKKNIPIRIACCKKSRLLLNKYYKGAVPDYEGIQLCVSWDILKQNQNIMENVKKEDLVLDEILHPESYDYQNYLQNNDDNYNVDNQITKLKQV